MPGESTLAGMGVEVEAVATAGGKIVAAAQHGEQEASAAVHMTKSTDTVVNAESKAADFKASVPESSSASRNMPDEISKMEIRVLKTKLLMKLKCPVLWGPIFQALQCIIYKSFLIP